MSEKSHILQEENYMRLQAKTFCALEPFFPDKRIALLIENIDDALKEQVFYKLIRCYGEEASAALFKNGQKQTIQLKDINHCKGEAVFVFPVSLCESDRHDFTDLLTIMQRLLGENGCAWDKAQTHESIKINMIEEAYELLEAIDLGDAVKMEEESGDVLLQAVFHACIAERLGEFDASDVLSTLCKKLIGRHTHIFGDVQANTTEEALSAWEAAKSKEKKYRSASDKMDKVANNLPRLLYAQKIQKIAAKAGMDFADDRAAGEKIAEEYKEFINDPCEEEGGDLLFSVVNVLRRAGIESETALEKSVKKFIRRFREVEKRAGDMKNCLSEELDKLWQEAKDADSR